MGESQQNGLAACGADRVVWRLAQDRTAISVRDDQPGLVGDHVARETVGHREIERIAKRKIFRPFCVGAKVGHRHLDLDKRQAARAVQARNIDPAPIREGQFRHAGQPMGEKQPPDPARDGARITDPRHTVDRIARWHCFPPCLLCGGPLLIPLAAMLNRYQSLIFTFRPYVLSVIAALTVYAAFQALRLVQAPLPPPTPEAGSAVAQTAALYDQTFGADKALPVVLLASPGERFDAPAGAAFREAVGTALSALRDVKTGGPLLREKADFAFHVSQDGRRGVLELPLVPHAVVGEAGLARALEDVTAQAGEDRFGAVPLPSSLRQSRTLFDDWQGPMWIAASASVLALGLLAYSGSFALTGLALATALLAIIWQVGLWSALGGHLTSAMRLIPSLILALAIGHAFPFARRFMRKLATGVDGEAAAADAVQRLAPAGAAAIAGTSLALLGAALAPIPALQSTALFAALGVLLLFPAMFVVLPLVLVTGRIDLPPDILPQSPSTAPPARRTITRGAPETVAVLALAAIVIAGLEAKEHSFGPYHAGREDQSAESRLNALTNALAEDPGNPNAMLTVLAHTSPELCTTFDTLDAIDQLDWQLTNLPGVTRVEGLPDALRVLTAGNHGGQPTWRAIPRERIAALQAMAELPPASALVSPGCDLLPLRVYVAIPIGKTLARVARTVEKFSATNRSDGLTFSLAGGPLAGVLAEAGILKSREGAILFAALTALTACMLIALADARALVATFVSGTVIFLAAGWAAAAAQIGISAQSALLMLFAVLLPIDLTAYALAATRDAPVNRREGEEWRFLWKRDGRPFVARTATVVCAFALWHFSPDQGQADCGLIVSVCAVVGAIATLLVMPSAMILAGRCARAMRGQP